MNILIQNTCLVTNGLATARQAFYSPIQHFIAPLHHLSIHYTVRCTLYTLYIYKLKLCAQVERHATQ